MNIIRIMQNTLDGVDKRLTDHGLRVAYLTYKIMRRRKKFSRQQLRDICLVALLHDVGAYKTEEIDKMLYFETADIWRHSIYGYLFIKKFSPLWELSPAIFFHHADCRSLECLHPSYRDLANILSICDRADIFTQLSGKDESALRENLRRSAGKQFLPHVVEAFFEAIPVLKLDKDTIAGDEEFIGVLYQTPLTDQEIRDYLIMLALSIDFRSRQTAIHTIAVSRIAALLASFAGLDEQEKEKIAIAALLHDIGKTGVPVDVLENPNRLSSEQMTVMKTHVLLSEEIIGNCVSREIKNIAVRHHEKLDGSGYPHGLQGCDLTFNERLLAVADILSALAAPRSYKAAYPKEKTCAILRDMAGQGAIDSGLVDLAICNFDSIAHELERESKPIIETYEEILREYETLLSRAHQTQNATSCALLIPQGCSYL